MNPKVIAFRPTEKEQAVINQYMKDKGIKTTTEAMKQAIKFLSRLEQTPKVTSMVLPESKKSELPYALQQELNRFLRGQLPCPTIEAIFGLNANSKIKIMLP